MAARECEFDGCDKRRYAYNLCAGHNAQRRKGAKLTPLRKFTTHCTVDGCREKHRARGLCNMHYHRYHKGDPEFAGPPRRNKDGEGNVSVHGYVRITVNGKSMAERRWIMEQHLGRPLLPQETVHHRNGDKTDNRLGNLELWSSSHPAGQRVEDKVAWATEILALYAPEVLSISDNGNKLAQENLQ